jgi:hypothetical protein
MSAKCCAFSSFIILRKRNRKKVMSEDVGENNSSPTRNREREKENDNK